MRRIMPILAALLLAGGALAQCQTPRAVNLRPYLQGEVNEVAVLTAQADRLQTRGDATGAALLQSYIPDHQQQAARLREAIRNEGGNPDTVQPTGTPYFGSRLAMVRYDERAHARVMAQYQTLLNRATTPSVRTLAMLGLNGASRHHNSLVVVRASSMTTRSDHRTALVAALALERGAVADLQTQSDRLTVLGDTNAAGTLQALVPPHQQQIARLERLLTEAGGHPAQVTAPVSAALPSRDLILANAHTENLQLASTYTLAISYLPAGPMANTFAQGRTVASQAMASLENRTTPPV